MYPENSWSCADEKWNLLLTKCNNCNLPHFIGYWRKQNHPLIVRHEILLLMWIATQDFFVGFCTFTNTYIRVLHLYTKILFELKCSIPRVPQLKSFCMIHVQPGNFDFFNNFVLKSVLKSLCNYVCMHEYAFLAYAHSYI